MTRMFASLFVAVAIAAASTGAANAESTYKISSVAVSYADLDLTRVEGVKTLSSRLGRAVDKVCGRKSDTASMTMRRKIATCRTESMNRAVAAIDAPLLTAFYQGSEGTRFAGL